MGSFVNYIAKFTFHIGSFVNYNTRFVNQIDNFESHTVNSVGNIESFLKWGTYLSSYVALFMDTSAFSLK